MLNFQAESNKGRVTLRNCTVKGAPWEIAADIEMLVSSLIIALKNEPILYEFLKAEFKDIYHDPDEEEKDGISDELAELLKKVVEAIKEDEKK